MSTLVVMVTVLTWCAGLIGVLGGIILCFVELHEPKKEFLGSAEFVLLCATIVCVVGASLTWQALQIERLQGELRQAQGKLKEMPDTEKRIAGYEGLVAGFSEKLHKCAVQLAAAQKP